MSSLEKRVAQLEEQFGVKLGPYPYLITTNVNFDHPDEPPPEQIVVPGIYLITYGRPLTPAELEQFRAEYKREHDDEFSKSN